MAITYRLQKGSRLTVEEMDGNFQYVENYLTGLTSSVSNLVSVIAGITASEAMQDSTVIAGLTASVSTLTTGLASATASIGTLETNLASATASIVDLQNALRGGGGAMGINFGSLEADSQRVYIDNRGVLFESLNSNNPEESTTIGEIKQGNGGLLITGREYDENNEDVFVGLTSDMDYSERDEGNPLIYAQRSYVDKANSYSTDEIKTGGTWIDGKPIYRKVIVLSETGSTGDDVKNLENLYIKQIIDIKGTVFTGGSTYPINSDLSANSLGLTLVKYDTDSLSIYWEGIGNTSDFTIILEYNKTTD